VSLCVCANVCGSQRVGMERKIKRGKDKWRERVIEREAELKRESY
jgi:hypothetical protein